MTPAGRWLEESLLTEGGRQALAEILRAVREEDPDGDAARYRRLKAALAEAMAPSAEWRLLDALAPLLPPERQGRLEDARAIYALAAVLPLFRELGLLPEGGGD